MRSLVFKYSFPVPLHGNNKEVTMEIISRRNPTVNEVRFALNKLKTQAEEEQQWMKVKEWDACLYALNNLHSDELPKLSSNSLRGAPAFCDTSLGKKSVIMIQLVEQTAIPDNPHEKKKLAQG